MRLRKTLASLGAALALFAVGGTVTAESADAALGTRFCNQGNMLVYTQWGAYGTSYTTLGKGECLQSTFIKVYANKNGYMRNGTSMRSLPQYVWVGVPQTLNTWTAYNS